jgi:hypothetical protein
MERATSILLHFLWPEVSKPEHSLNHLSIAPEIDIQVSDGLIAEACNYIESGTSRGFTVTVEVTPPSYVCNYRNVISDFFLFCLWWRRERWFSCIQLETRISTYSTELRRSGLCSLTGLLTEGSPSGLKRPEFEVQLSSETSDRVRTTRLCWPILLYIFMAKCLII